MVAGRPLIARARRARAPLCGLACGLGALLGVLPAHGEAPPPGGVEAPAGPEEARSAPATPELQPIPDAPQIGPGAVVHLEYTLRTARGEILDSTRGGIPLVFTVGANEVIPGLERGLLGMTAGETRRLTVPPDEGYGLVDPAAVVEVPKERVPPESRRAGATLPGETRSGRPVSVRVREVRETTVLLDLNHPLAGQTLVFEVRVILVEPPP